MNIRRLLPLLFLVAAAACNNDEEPWPSLITEMADILTDEEGTLCQLHTDSEVNYQLTNPVAGYAPSVAYRILADYTDEGNGRATLYQMTPAYILRDSTACGQTHPTGVLSVWRASRYINLRLTPKTKGGQMYFGFLVDSIRPGRVFLSLHHNQHSDPLAYTREVYASLPVDSIPGLQAGDSVSLTVRTFDGQKTWSFKQ